MTFSETEKQQRENTVLPGDAYLLEDAKQQLLPQPVSIILHQDGFQLYLYQENGERRMHQNIAYNETLIRCSLNDVPDSVKPYVIQLEAGLRTIFICYAACDERNTCFTKILASIGQFLVLNPRSRKATLRKKISSPLSSPVSPRTLSSWPSTKQFSLSSLLNALDISSPGPYLHVNNAAAHRSNSFRFPTSLVSLCNTKCRSKEQLPSYEKKPVGRSYTLPFSKHSTAISCKQYSARNTLVNEPRLSHQSSLETRAALGMLNIDSGDMRQYLARS